MEEEWEPTEVDPEKNTKRQDTGEEGVWLEVEKEQTRKKHS